MAQKPILVEAENFMQQTRVEKRSWKVIEHDSIASIASGGKYLQCLPDTRLSHADKLIPSENFSNKAGEMAVLSYPVHIKKPGKY